MVCHGAQWANAMVSEMSRPADELDGGQGNSDRQKGGRKKGGQAEEEEHAKNRPQASYTCQKRWNLVVAGRSSLVRSIHVLQTLRWR